MIDENGNNGRRSLSLRAIDVPQVPEEHTYQAKLRDAIYNGVTESDVVEVVKGIVKRAKEGDKAAVCQLFDFVLGAKTPQKVVINNSFDNVEQAAKIASNPKNRIRR